MSLKTPDSRLKELGLSRYQLIYDDEESYPNGSDRDPSTKHIAWLYNASGKDIGWWGGTLVFTLHRDCVSRPSLEDLTALTDVLKELR